MSDCSLPLQSVADDPAIPLAQSTSAPPGLVDDDIQFSPPKPTRLPAKTKLKVKMPKDPSQAHSKDTSRDEPQEEPTAGETAVRDTLTKEAFLTVSYFRLYNSRCHLLCCQIWEQPILLFGSLSFCHLLHLTTSAIFFQAGLTERVMMVDRVRHKFAASISVPTSLVTTTQGVKNIIPGEPPLKPFDPVNATILLNTFDTGKLHQATYLLVSDRSDAAAAEEKCKRLLQQRKDVVMGSASTPGSLANYLQVWLIVCNSFHLQ